MATQPTVQDGQMAETALENSWAVWIQRSKGTGKDEEFQKVGEFSTAESFWAAWRWIPAPSQVFSTSAQRPGRKRIVALCLFKDGIEPRSDHRQNIKGGKWSSLQIARRGDRLGCLGSQANILEDGVKHMMPPPPLAEF